MLVDVPLQIDVAVPTVAEGREFTVIFIESVLLQPVELMVSVNLYIVVIVGLTEGLLLVEVNPEGLLVQL